MIRTRGHARASANMLAMVFLDSQSTNYVSRNDLRFAHHLQHPVQKQGRPVPKRSLAQRWLRLLGQSAIGNRQSATAVENFASTGNRELAPMSLAEKQHCYCTNPLTHA